MSERGSPTPFSSVGASQAVSERSAGEGANSVASLLCSTGFPSARQSDRAAPQECFCPSHLSHRRPGGTAQKCLRRCHFLHACWSPRVCRVKHACVADAAAAFARPAGRCDAARRSRAALRRAQGSPAREACLRRSITRSPLRSGAVSRSSLAEHLPQARANDLVAPFSGHVFRLDHARKACAAAISSTAGLTLPTSVPTNSKLRVM